MSVKQAHIHYSVSIGWIYNNRKRYSITERGDIITENGDIITEKEKYKYKRDIITQKERYNY